MRRNQQTSTPDYAHAGKVSKTQFFVSRSSFLVSEHFELTAKQEPACVLFRDFPPPRQERATKGGQPLRWSGARFYAARDPEGFLWWVSNYTPVTAKQPRASDNRQ